MQHASQPSLTAQLAAHYRHTRRETDKSEFMNAKKIISIITGLVAYIIVSAIFHELFRGKPDIASGISYIYNDMLYVVGFVFTFMFYGCNKINRALFVLLSIIFLSLVIYNWWIVSSMPYERFLYIGLGTLVYICETIYLRTIGGQLDT